MENTTKRNWLNIQEVADYLRCSQSQIRKLVSAGQIPYKRLPNGKSGKLLFNTRQIDLWLLTGEIKPSARARQTFEALID
ncbi:MAG TPA: helix-turn-helix domain-containing protein [Candidatus Marinimicrobia bacterium]|nr:helix-turn-helix domain-containing protein [Candidatus Neomarinimicrobiota bacterium]HRS51823.1 helix-turn-helix domain-containing protein [Candidatus Neomarinimicrobiota bacterium]HRU92625.1 helix-turn-helix domain-containing protein [Candidatus Neomarinimicrobiota bacterium]